MLSKIVKFLSKFQRHKNGFYTKYNSFLQTKHINYDKSNFLLGKSNKISVLTVNKVQKSEEIFILVIPSLTAADR